MNKCAHQGTFERLCTANPHPTTELNSNSSFELLIAVLLSMQATDVGANKATAKLFPVAATSQMALDLRLDGVMEYIKTTGLYKTKSKRTMRICCTLPEKYHGGVPAGRSALEALPGVGYRTANVVLNTALGQPVMAADAHIFRVSNRTKVVPGKDAREVEDKLVRFTSKEFLAGAHHRLILHGCYICKALKPQCKTCTINDLCEYSAKLTWSGERGRLKPGRFTTLGGIGTCGGKF